MLRKTRLTLAAAAIATGLTAALAPAAASAAATTHTATTPRWPGEECVYRTNQPANAYVLPDTGSQVLYRLPPDWQVVASRDDVLNAGEGGPFKVNKDDAFIPSDQLTALTCD